MKSRNPGSGKYFLRVLVAGMGSNIYLPVRRVNSVKLGPLGHIMLRTPLSLINSNKGDLEFKLILCSLTQPNFT